LFQGLWLPALLGLCLTLYESLWAGFGSGLDLKSGGENPAEIFIWLGLLFFRNSHRLNAKLPNFIGQESGWKISLPYFLGT